MARLEIQHNDLVVRLSGWEKLAAMRGEVRVPLTEVRSACVDADPWSAMRGIRAPGTGIPGVIAYGMRRMTGAVPDFVAVHGRGRAIRVGLGAGAPYGRLVVTEPEADRVLAEIRARLTNRGGS